MFADHIQTFGLMVPCPDQRNHADSHKVWRALVKAGRVPTNDSDQIAQSIQSGV